MYLRNAGSNDHIHTVQTIVIKNETRWSLKISNPWIPTLSNRSEMTNGFLYNIIRFLLLRFLHLSCFFFYFSLLFLILLFFCQFYFVLFHLSPSPILLLRSWPSAYVLFSFFFFCHLLYTLLAETNATVSALTNVRLETALATSRVCHGRCQTFSTASESLDDSFRPQTSLSVLHSLRPCVWS
jgi:cellulose synthase/poly-beta-1,6-N-acetylglucosamine synthase-like glycosyltransferase